MITDSVLYWLGIIAVIVTAFLLLKKLLQKPNDDLTEKLKQIMSVNNEQLGRIIKESNNENTQKLIEVMNKNNEHLIQTVRDGACKYVKSELEKSSDKPNL